MSSMSVLLMSFWHIVCMFPCELIATFYEPFIPVYDQINIQSLHNVIWVSHYSTGYNVPWSIIVMHVCFFFPIIKGCSLVFINSFIHSFIHSSIHLFIHSFIHPFIYSFIHSFICSFIYLCPSVYLPVPPCVHSLTLSPLTHSLSPLSLTHFLTHSLSFIHSFVHSFIHLFVPFIHSFVHLPV